MYCAPKVYFNNVVFTFPESFSGENERVLHLNGQKPTWMSWIEELQEAEGEFYCCSLNQSGNEVWIEFQKDFQLITAAGGVVRNENEDVLMIFRRGKWDLPKGKVDDGETIDEAALREVKEECGLKTLVIKDKRKIVYHIYFHKNKWVLKDTHWFNMIGSLKDELIPQTEEDITAIEWMNTNDEEWKSNTFASILEVMYP